MSLNVGIVAASANMRSGKLAEPRLHQVSFQCRVHNYERSVVPILARTLEAHGSVRRPNAPRHPIFGEFASKSLIDAQAAPNKHF
ncbi:hypothetical protein [Sphingomonas sp. PAMC 26605]|uniref:hypothetical protein n=1 Tax=Sphingomonas sp. PAMC 26605 TaxID=1112214 RepID=UPI0012F49735|nr:hypothetical protein [Sphingomonas sp. PAMC 26605]